MHVGAHLMDIDGFVKGTLGHHAVIASPSRDVDGCRTGSPGLQFHRGRSRTQIQTHLGGVGGGRSIGRVMHLENKRTAGRQEFGRLGRIFALVHAGHISGIIPIQPTLNRLEI